MSIRYFMNGRDISPDELRDSALSREELIKIVGYGKKVKEVRRKNSRQRSTGHGRKKSKTKHPRLSKRTNVRCT